MPRAQFAVEVGILECEICTWTEKNNPAGWLDAHGTPPDKGGKPFRFCREHFRDFAQRLRAGGQMPSIYKRPRNNRGNGHGGRS